MKPWNWKSLEITHGIVTKVQRNFTSNMRNLILISVGNFAKNNNED